MWNSRVRIRNKILQLLYRPSVGKYSFFSKEFLVALDEIESGIERRITPLLSDLFD